MSGTASDQLKRILHLIPRVADDKEHRLEDLASLAGVSPSELIADLSAISERYDTPGGFVEGLSIFVEDDSVSVHANHFHRPMRLTMPELCALELGLVMLRRERTLAEQAPIDRALARLREAITHVPSNDRYEGTRYAELALTGSAEHLATLREAHRDRRKVDIRYRSGSATESSMRTICPDAIVYAEHMWYVVATCSDSVARFFRLDRIETVNVLDERFEPDARAMDRVLEQGRTFASETSRQMTVRYSPHIARWVAEREGKALDDDGSLTLLLPVADDAWAVRHVLQYGPEAEILAPDDLRALLVERLKSVTSS
jgi:predicted DNA-binding transcriptional regulator YafY